MRGYYIVEIDTEVFLNFFTTGTKKGYRVNLGIPEGLTVVQGDIPQRPDGKTVIFCFVKQQEWMEEDIVINPIFTYEEEKLNGFGNLQRDLFALFNPYKVVMSSALKKKISRTVPFRTVKNTQFHVTDETLFGIPVKTNEDMPDDEIAVVDDSGKVYRIVNIGGE